MVHDELRYNVYIDALKICRYYVLCQIYITCDCYENGITYIQLTKTYLIVLVTGLQQDYVPEIYE